MRKVLIIALILALVYPFSIFAADNRAVRSGALPITSGFGSDHLGAYADATTPQEIWVINTLVFDDPAVPAQERNGLTVIEGGLKAALEDSTDNKMIFFEVSGVIDFEQDRVTLGASNVGIYGQTAPSPGIFIKNLSLLTNGEDNLLFQHIRMGGNAEESVENAWDTVNVGSDAASSVNVIFDHCTLLYGYDEILPIVNSTNIIVSNSILALPIPGQGAYQRVTMADEGSIIFYYGNLLAHAGDRQPYVVQGSSVVMSNNWIYNHYPFGPILQGEWYLVMDSNIVDAGPNDRSSIGANYWLTYKNDPHQDSEIYAINNKCDAAPAQADANDYVEVRALSTSVPITNYKQASAADVINVPYGTAEENLDTVKANITATVGARPFDRIEVENRVVAEANAGTGSHINAADLAQIWVDMADVENVNGKYIVPDYRNLETGMGTKFNQIPGSTETDDGSNGWGNEDGRTNLMEWVDEMAVYVETGKFPGEGGGGGGGNNFVADPNCVGHYFSGSSVVADGQEVLNNAHCTGSAAPDACCTGLDEGTCFPLNAAAGESEWVEVSDSDSNAYIGSASTRYFQCQAITDAGGITLSKIRIYGHNIGDLESPQKTIYVHKNTQVGDTPGGALDATPGTQIGSISGDNDWNNGAIDIDVTDTGFVENDLICLSMLEIDSGDYLKILSNGDDEAKLGDIQQFESDGSHYQTVNEDFKIILYESAGTPPAYIDSVATFDGSTHFLYAAITDLNDNVLGRTGKTNGSFVMKNVIFTTFPDDANEDTLFKLPDAYELVIKTVAPNNYLEWRVWDGAAWDVVTSNVDLDAATPYDIQVSANNDVAPGDLQILDVATSVDSTRIEARIETEMLIVPPTPEAGNLTIGYDGTSEFFTGSIESFVIFDDIVSADQFLDMSEGDYGSPGPTFDTLVATAGVYNELGGTITMTGTTSEEMFVTGAAPYFDCTGGIRFGYVSKDGTDISIVSSGIDNGEETDGLTCDASWTLPSGTTVQDANQEDATLTLPTITNAADVKIRGIVDPDITYGGTSF